MPGKKREKQEKGMKKQKKGKFLRLAGLLVFLLAAAAGAGIVNRKLTPVVRREDGRKFGATYMTMNNPFYEIIDDELRSVVESRGDILITRDPALSVPKQIQQVEEMIERKVDAIFINPVDWKEIGSALEEAAQAGIPIIVVDSEIFDEDLASCTVVSDNYEAGVQCARHMLENHDQGNILLLTHSATKSGLDRIQGFKDTIEGYPQFSILAEEDCLGQLELAMPATEKMLAQYPQADVIMCLNDVAAMGAMAALKDAGLTEKFAVYGVDGSPDGKSMIAEGIMEATAAQFPRQIAREAAEAAYRIIGQEQTESVIRIETELISRENLERYGSDGWQ